MTNAYVPRRQAQSRFVPLRGLRYHAHVWGDLQRASAEQPPIFMLHGWMDVGASFQFVVDALADLGLDRCVIAPDWRGFGRTEGPRVDTYWMPDYLGDLDALLDALAPTHAVDLVGHSLGGNVVMNYTGVRCERVRRLDNLEGFGLPRTRPTQAPKRLAQWLDGLRQPQTLRDYADLAEVAARLRKNNPRLSADKAQWLAPHWARLEADGRWHVQGDPAHKQVNPVLYRVDEIEACWRLIHAPVLWVEGEQTDLPERWGPSYSRDEFASRLSVVEHLEKRLVAAAGHMLHHDQPAVVAAAIASFLA